MALGKNQAISIVFSAADAYSVNLENKTLLFLSVDKHYRVSCTEVTFGAANFCHLTGLKTTLKPKHFYSKCLKRRLCEGDFEFSHDGTTELKLDVLPKVVMPDLSARMIGRYNNTHPRLYTEVLAGTERACLGFKDIGSGLYVPNTLLKEDVRRLTSGKPDRIVMTRSKGCRDARYSSVVFASKKIDWNRIKMPSEYAYLGISK